MGVTPAQAAALAAGRIGGDRYADKRRIVAVIEQSLFDGLSDVECRSMFGYAASVEVTDGMRRRIAQVRAPRVYRAIIAKMVAAASGQIIDGVGGLMLDGLMRIGVTSYELSAGNFRDPQTGRRAVLANPAADEVLMYRRETYENGWFAVWHGGDAAARADLLGRGWVVPWWGAGSPSIVYGPVRSEDVHFGYGPVPWLGGGAANYQLTSWRLGSRNYQTGKNMGWAFRDDGGEERQVAVTWSRRQAGKLIAIPVRDFVLEMTNFVPA